RQVFLARVGDAEGDEVVPPAGTPERPLEILIAEIAQQEDDCAPVQHPVQVIESLAQAGAVVGRLEEQHVANETQDMAGSLARWDEALDPVGEGYQADAITVGDGTEGQHGGQLGGYLTLLVQARAELLTAA